MHKSFSKYKIVYLEGNASLFGSNVRKHYNMIMTCSISTCLAGKGAKFNQDNYMFTSPEIILCSGRNGLPSRWCVHSAVEGLKFKGQQIFKHGTVL